MAELLASRVFRRVLIVDDDLAFAHLLEEDFKTRAFEVEMAGTREEAVARVTAGAPDLVVLDLYLADGAALNLVRLWRTEAPAMLVILVSGKASLNAVVDGLKEGAQRFFTKPVTAGALIDELEERQRAREPPLAPSVGSNYQLGTAALKAEGIDRFFAVSPGLLSIVGFDGYFKMLNPAWERVLGYSVQELCSKPYLDLVHPDDREKATDEALEICGGHTVFRFRNRYRCKDGTFRWLAWIATPSPAHQLIYASARDVTKTVRMEQGLRESNQRLQQVVENGEVLLRESTDKNDTLVELGRAKDDLAAMLVHDLKGPLSVIVSNYDYIVEGFEGSADCLDALLSSQSAVRRMLRLLANLVDLARLETGKLSVHTSEVALSQLLLPLVEERRVLAGLRDITVVLAAPPELTATVDADVVTRTVENIFDNALRHTPTGGTIELSVRDVGPEVEIRIGNSGPPIPVGERKSVFDKYWQAGSKVGRMNLGLGLYFCRLATEAQGGSISVEETERLPTVFCVRLPRRGSAVARQTS